MLSAAGAVNWAAKTLAFDNEAALFAAAARLAPAERATAPLFLPYLSGERTPHNQPLASGVWFGMTAAHGRDALAYSVAEGAGFGLTAEGDGFAVETDLPFIARGFC
eukprot:gene20337-biopygen13489